MKHKRRPHLSAGSLIMLGLTLAVLLGCAWFMARITGGGVAARAAHVLQSLRFAQETAAPRATYIAAMTLQPVLTATPAPSATAAPTPSPTPVPEKVSLTIAAAGAVYAPKAIRQTVEDASGEADFAPVFAPVAQLLAGADLTIATLETTTAGSERGYGNYNTPASILDALREAGVDLLSLGTERALDKGYEGLAVTRQEITRRGLSCAGAYADGQSAGEAVMLRIGGVQVAVLAYTYGLSEEGRAQTQEDSQGLVPLMELTRMRADIARARSEGANLVIVLPHWGTKNKMEIPEQVRTLARELAAAGADIILGTHPNVPQGVERIQTERADGLTYETVVCYSLGSLLTDARTAENTASMAVHIPAEYDPVTRRVTLGEAQVTPLYIARVREGEETAYRVVPAGEEAALAGLDEAEREAARQAAAIVRSAQTSNQEEP